MASFTAGTTFVDGVSNDVTAAKLGALVTNATPTSGFIQDRTAETVTATNDTLLIGDASDSNNLKRITVANFAQTLPTAKVTTGTIDTGTFGTTTSTAATITTGTIPTLVATTLITTGTGTAAAPAIVPTGDTNTGFFFPAADTIAFSEGGAEAMRIDSSGRVGINVTSPLYKLQVDGDAALTDTSSLYWATAGGTTRTSITGDSSGNLKLQTGASNTERLRITSGGALCIGRTTYNLDSDTGVCFQDGSGVFTANGGSPIFANRKGNDGIIIGLYQDATLEGNISVSGNTVSYNPFAGSHWSQLEDGSKPQILRGTVIESINQLCQWPDGGNERFAKCKISNTVASKKVYGVFLDWDNDWTQTNDLYVTSVGLFVCRINTNVTVQIGDLLESNGDGTARVQADDVIRSSTIGKVTSSIKTHEYQDGSYCVPTVLYCG